MVVRTLHVIAHARSALVTCGRLVACRPTPYSLGNVSHYDCLDLASLAALPIAELAAENCALFLWAIDPLLPRAFDLILAWEFEYKTVAFYWVKLNNTPKRDADYFTGLGYLTRANHEPPILLVARG
jgi:N6-adenosine-specific RNA methylase IME4